MVRGFLTGLQLGLAALLSKELRSRSRGWRPMWVLTGYLIALTLGVTGFLALVTRVGRTVPPNLGTQLFSALALGAVLLLALITPALTVGAISSERERRTLDLLLVTPASALGLVSGKLLASLVYILFLLVASLPAFALVYLFGGVPPAYIAMALAVVTATALAHAALGLLLSAVIKRTAVASVLAYLLVFALLLGLPLAGALVRGMARLDPGDRVPPPPVYVQVHPLASLSSVLPAGVRGGSVPLVGDLLRAVFSDPDRIMEDPGAGIRARMTYLARAPQGPGEQPELVQVAAPWVQHFLFSAILTLACLFGAAMALMPVRPWQVWRARRRLQAPA